MSTSEKNVLNEQAAANVKAIAVESANKVAEQVAEQLEVLADEVSKIKSGAPEVILTKSDAKAKTGELLNIKLKKFLLNEENGGGQLPQGTKLSNISVEEEDAAAAGLSVKSLSMGGAGGASLSVQEVLGSRVIERARESVAILSLIGSKSVSSTEYREMVLRGYPEVSKGVENVGGVNWDATGTQTYEEVVMQIAKQYAKPQITTEALKDSSIDLMAMLERLLSEEMSRYWALQVLYGAGGPDNLRGILSSKRINKVESQKSSDVRDFEHFPIILSGEKGKLTPEETTSSIVNKMIDMTIEVPTAYQANSRFVMNRKTLGMFRKMKISDTDADGVSRDNRPLVTFSEGAFRLIDFPVSVEDYMPNVADAAAPATTVTTPIIFGDLSKAYVLCHIDDDYLVDPYTEDGRVVIKATSRKGELIQNNDAIVVLYTDAA